jgi:hypothetical protein
MTYSGKLPAILTLKTGIGRRSVVEIFPYRINVGTTVGTNWKVVHITKYLEVDQREIG